MQVTHYSVESSDVSNRENPRLDTTNNGWKNSAGNTADYWVEITFAGNLHFVHEVILEKTAVAYPIY